MATYTFDSSVIIAYKVRELPKDFVLSAVVVAELTAGAPDNSTRKDYEALAARLCQVRGVGGPYIRRLAHREQDPFLALAGPQEKDGRQSTKTRPGSTSANVFRRSYCGECQKSRSHSGHQRL